MQFEAVSTFNAIGLATYGRRMADSFDQHWPEDVQLTVYAEGWGDGLPARIVDLIGASPWLAEFKARHAHLPTTDYRKDAVRFAHKAAAVCHAAQTSDADVLVWIDGDVVTHEPLTLRDLDALAPRGDEWIAWLDRVNMYPECGFYMLNMRHPRHSDVVRMFERMYAEDGLFLLHEWHDSYVLNAVVRQAGVAAKSLSGEARTTTHPMINGPLGCWFDHLKGGRRKRQGRSSARDLTWRRSEEYWKAG